MHAHWIWSLISPHDRRGYALGAQGSADTALPQTDFVRFDGRENIYSLGTQRTTPTFSSLFNPHTPHARTSNKHKHMAASRCEQLCPVTRRHSPSSTGRLRERGWILAQTPPPFKRGEAAAYLHQVTGLDMHISRFLSLRCCLLLCDGEERTT